MAKTLDDLMRTLSSFTNISAMADDIMRDQAEKTAQVMRDELGHGPVGDFPAWEELAEATMDNRERLGYTRDDILLMSAQMQSDITVTPQGPGDYMVGIPQDAPSAKYADVMEKGTRDGNTPARPFIEPALIDAEAGMLAAAGDALGAALGPDLSFDIAASLSTAQARRLQSH